MLCGGYDARWRRAFLGENVPDKPNTPMNCEFHWSMQWRTHAGQMLDCKHWTIESVVGHEGGIAHHGQSLISTIALFKLE